MSFFFLLTDCANLGLVHPDKTKLSVPESCNRYTDQKEFINALRSCWIANEDKTHVVRFNDPPKKSAFIDIKTGKVETKIALNTDLKLFDWYINDLVRMIPSNDLVPTKLTLNQDCCKVFVYKSESPVIKLNYNDINKIFPQKID